MYPKPRTKAVTLKLLRKKNRQNLNDLAVQTNLMNSSPFTQEIRPIINKWDFIKLRNFFAQLIEQLTWRRGSLQIGREYFPAIYLIEH